MLERLQFQLFCREMPIISHLLTPRLPNDSPAAKIFTISRDTVFVVTVLLFGNYVPEERIATYDGQNNIVKLLTPKTLMIFQRILNLLVTVIYASSSSSQRSLCSAVMNYSSSRTHADSLRQIPRTVSKIHIVGGVHVQPEQCHQLGTE